jgi:hypothetical protein
MTEVPYVREALAASASEWCLIRDVEAIWCWLPDWEHVLTGSHVVACKGNDGLGINIEVDTREALKYAGDMSELIQLAWMGKFLAKFRHDEGRRGIPEAFLDY